MQGVILKELSIFADESGDYGAYDYRSPYYIVTLVFHDQSNDLSQQISKLNEMIRKYGRQERAIHTGPLIRREDDYLLIDRETRRKMFNSLFNFAKRADFEYRTFVVEKKQSADVLGMIAMLSRQISRFLNDHLSFFTDFERIVLYYDNGQAELTRLLVSLLNATVNVDIEFKKALPSDYKLSQVADLLCTLELLSLKMKKKALSKSEQRFFTPTDQVRKTYMSAMLKKRFE
jgi:hypothetical protein